MLIKVRGYRGCERADIELAPHALVAGRNFQGKSSLCEAVAAALTGEALPYFRPSRPDKPILTKTEGKELVRGGVKKGGVQIEVDEKIVSGVVWPELSVEGDGSVECSKIAAGLLDPMEFEDAHRQQYFSWLLEAEPSDEDAAAAFKDAGVSTEAASTAWQAASTQGIDVAYRKYKEDGAKLKGRWEQSSGEAFGAKKMIDWRPQGWVVELDGAAEATLAEDCLAARGKVESAIAARAHDAAGIQQLRDNVGLETKAIADHAAAVTASDAAVAEKRRLEKVVASIIVPSALPCPACGAFLDIVPAAEINSTRADVYPVALQESTATADDIENAREAKKEAQGLLDQAVKVGVEAANAVSEATRKCKEFAGSQAKLEAAMKHRGTQEAVELAQDQQRTVESHYAMVKARETCLGIAIQIASNQKIVDILAPEGLRRQKLVKALANFNKGLAQLCTQAGYPIMALTDALEIQYGGRRYWLLSKSEKYRVRCVLQTIAALYDDSPVVILDGADILDAEGRSGLMQMIASDAIADKRFLIAMTVNDAANVPNLAEFELGHTYWMDAAQAKEMVSS